MIRIIHSFGICACVALLSFGPATGWAAETLTPWFFEAKIGVLEPDLPLYEDFYGSKSDTYFAVAFGYQFTDWVELGGELGYLRDTGVGFQASNNALGGKVKYSFFPAHIFVNFLGRFSDDQLFIPYAGAGLTSAYYEQDVESQPGRSGRTDFGYNARAGVQLFLNRLDKRTSERLDAATWFHSYLFLEAQWFTTEVDQQDLGGVAYLGGLRMEFGRR